MGHFQLRRLFHGWDVNLGRYLQEERDRDRAWRDGIEQRRLRREALALLAYDGTNPTQEEASGFQPGYRRDSLEGVAGASITEDPTGAIADLQQELRNEELQRAAERNAPAVARLQQQLALKDAGYDPSALALADQRLAQTDTIRTRGNALKSVLEDPGLDPLLATDIANDNTVSTPQRVKVRRRDGAEVYMDARRTLSGGWTYSPAEDTTGAALRVPPSATASELTSEQRNIQNRARIIKRNNPGMTDEEAENEAYRSVTSLKGKETDDAWESIVRETAKASYGRYARDPRRLYDESRKRWIVARPGEEPPAFNEEALAAAVEEIAPVPAAQTAAEGNAARAEKIRADYKAGRIKREDAIEQLRRLGYK